MISDYQGMVGEGQNLQRTEDFQCREAIICDTYYSDG